MNTTANTSYDELTWSDLIPETNQYKTFIQSGFYIYNFHTSTSGTTVAITSLYNDTNDNEYYNNIDDFFNYITEADNDRIDNEERAYLLDTFLSKLQLVADHNN